MSLRARSFLGAFRLREATAELQTLIRDSSDVPAVYFYLAQVYSAQEQAGEAQQALNQALRIGVRLASRSCRRSL